MRLTFLFICIGISFKVAAQWTTGTNIYNTNTGNVGIGIQIPAEKLHVNGAIRGNGAAGALRINTTAGYIDVGPINTAFAHFYTNMSKYYFDKPVYADGGFSSYGSNDMLFMTNGISRMTIKNADGNVSIGGANSSAKFSVYQNVTGDYLNALQVISINPNIHWPLVVSTNSKMNHSGFVSSSNSDMYVLIRDKDGNANVQLNSRGNSFFTGGNVGIGIISPDGKLHVKGCAYFGNQNEDASHRVAVGASGGDYGSVGYGYLYSNTSNSYTRSVTDYASQLRFDQGGFTFNTAGSGGANQPVTFTAAMVINNNGNVGIGLPNPDARLTIKGDIHTNEVRVDVQSPIQVGDYVFEKEYKLLPLSKVEEYVNENKHLPEVPSAKEISKDGLKLKEMNLLLLKKVEELTLHLIEMEKTNQQQNQQIQKLQDEVKFFNRK